MVANPFSRHRDLVVTESMLHTLTISQPLSPICGESQDSDVNRSVVQLDAPKDNAYVCQECGASYLQYGRLANHMKSKHGIVNEKELFKCDQCEKSFDTVKKLNRHKKTHI